MTREQIEEKARDFCKKDVYGCNECCEECVQEIEKQKMIDLANWALSHQWVSVEDELPPINEKTNKSQKCFVRGDGAYGVTYQSAEYNANREGWEGFTFSPCNVTHWMPIPPLAEEGGNNE